MKFLLDTRALVTDPKNELSFGVASLWEIAIKSGLNRPDFQVNARLLRRGPIDNGYRELPILTCRVPSACRLA